MKYILIGIGALVVLEILGFVQVLGFITNTALKAKPGGDGPITSPAQTDAQA